MTDLGLGGPGGGPKDGFPDKVMLELHQERKGGDVGGGTCLRQREKQGQRHGGPAEEW